MLYQADVADLDAATTVRVHWEREPEPEAAVRHFAERLVHAVLDDRDAIDAVITSVSRRWTLDRIATIDRNLVRLGIGELRSEPETPAAVVIDEIVEIARDYGDAETGAFVHGLVEGARRLLRGEAPAEPRPTGAPARAGAEDQEEEP